MVAHDPITTATKRPAQAAKVWIVVLALLWGTAASGQELIDIETSEGSITIELYDHPDIRPFGTLFQVFNRGSIFHRSDKLLACDATTCSCESYDCTACLDGLDPEVICENGQIAECTCDDGTLDPPFLCDGVSPASLECADGTSATCTCPDASPPEFECMDLSDPPGFCTNFEVTDLTMRAGALHAGLYQLQADGQVVDIQNYIPTGMQTALGLFENDASAIAFVRDSSCNLTSEWIINLEDNSDVYDVTPCVGVPPPTDSRATAYLAFGVVVGSSIPIDTIATLATLDLTAELTDNSQVPPKAIVSCSNPPPVPLTSWITGVPDSSRCSGWDQFPLFDFSVDPVPPVLGNCVPGDEQCMCPGLQQPCVELALPICELLGATDATTGLTPCAAPICDDTQLVDPMSPGGLFECTEPLGANFPIVIPEPGSGAVALVALMTLALLRRAHCR